MNGSQRVDRLIRREKERQEEQEERAKVALGYARVSTEEQAKRGLGLQSQEKAIKAFAESQGYRLIDVVTDRGVSGATAPISRAGFSDVLRLAEERTFSVLLVWKIDRLARSLVHAVTTANDLGQEYDVLLRSVTEPIDTESPMGQTIFAILAGMAQQERQAITERTISGKKAKASRGGYVGATAPYGYRTDGQGNLVIHEPEAEVVRRIFAMREAGHTLQGIADSLNSEAVPTRRGAKWYPATVRYILDNPKYRGDVEYFFRWEGEQTRVLHKGEHRPIVE